MVITKIEDLGNKTKSKMGGFLVDGVIIEVLENGSHLVKEIVMEGFGKQYVLI